MNKPDHQPANTHHLDGLVGMVRNVFGVPKESTDATLSVQETDDVDEGDEMVVDGHKTLLDDRRLR